MPKLAHYERTFIDEQGDVQVNVNVTLYREGAIVNDAQAGAAPFTVLVHSVGKISRDSLAPDTVFFNTATGTTYSCYASDDTHVVLSGFVGSINVANGDEIIPQGDKPSLFQDGEGADSKSQPFQSGLDGYADAYLAAGVYEEIAVGTAGTSYRRVHVSSPFPGAVRYADEYAPGSVTGGIQEALDDLPADGGCVQLSANKIYDIDKMINLPQGVWLRGMGPTSVIRPTSIFEAPSGGVTDGLIRSPNSGGAPLYNLGSPGNFNVISDLKLDGRFSVLARPIENCIQLYGILDVQIRNVICVDGDNFGISVEAAVRVTISGCHVRDFADNSNSNGISVAGPGEGAGQASIVNNVIEDLGTIGIDVLGFDSVVIVGNDLKGCRYGINLEGNDAANGGSVANIVIANNNLVGTTDTNESGVTQNVIGITLWQRSTVGGLSTDVVNPHQIIANNTIRDYQYAMQAGGGHWLFTGNAVYNYGLGAGDASAISIGNVFGTNLRMANIAITNNYFSQTGSRASSGTVAVVRVNNGTAVGNIDNFVFKGNIINGQDLAAGGSNQHGLFIQSIGNNWDISDNYFRGTTNGPIRVLTNNLGAPTNWRIANNYFVDCNNKSGGSAAAWISLADANNLTWSKITVEGNIALDANSRMSSLISNSGTGWNGALRVHNNIAREATGGLLSLVSPLNLASSSDNIPEAFVFQTIATVGDTIVSGGTLVELALTPGSPVIMTSAPTIADGYHGQRVRLVNTDAAKTLRLSDVGTLANSNLMLTAATVDVPPHASIEFYYSASLTNWVQISPVTDAL